MTTIFYVIIVAVYIVFVYNIFDKLNKYCIVEEFNSEFLKFVFMVLLGFLLAGILIFFLKYITIPLIFIGLIYFLIIRKN